MYMYKILGIHFSQLTYSTTRYGLYEVVSAELRKGDGKDVFDIRKRKISLGRKINLLIQWLEL